MLKSSVVKTVKFFLPARKKYIRKQSTMECTQYTYAREILQNSTFPRQAAKCERAVCKQSIASPAENRCNQKKPSTTPLKWCWASLLSCFGAFLRIKPPVCCLLFFAILTRCPLFIVATVRFRDRKMDTFLCIGRNPERKKRVSAGCGNSA